MRIFLYIFVFLLPLVSNAQVDSAGKVKYNGEFEFTDGIYLTFNEFVSNNPSIKEFYIKKPTPIADPLNIELEYKCTDSVKTNKNCAITDCWGYSYKGNVYIAHSYYAYYFKVQVIGALCHFTGLSGVGIQTPVNNDVISGFGADNEYRQFMIDFKTGEINVFNYKNFSTFLKENDNELYVELSQKKRKKKFIFQYLLKYNERHPIYFPAQ